MTDPAACLCPCHRGAGHHATNVCFARGSGCGGPAPASEAEAAELAARLRAERHQ